jgi:hypothetical protein
MSEATAFLLILLLILGPFVLLGLSLPRSDEEREQFPDRW